MIDDIKDEYKQRYKCKEFADELEAGSKENCISGERIELNSKYSDFIYSDRFGTISNNGYHTGIKIDNIVYDNLYPEGINYYDWLTDLGFTDYPEAFNLLEIIIG
ncbi:MAG: hypothetical protein K2K48_06805 [Anaeroplasmataceae bacterium]|nr:hypothetical protein [Anaeroplasmataceae bacterium]MDE6415109.1 hypothetical protein [Anaeroplasmataceae bacterium]